MSNPIKIIECPRDAMQGMHDFVPTQRKIDYINSLLEVGFDTIDFGSFVSPKAIPQMKDTAEVLNGLKLTETSSKLLAIVANERGAADACQFQEINFLGYPFSISETFQQRNTNASIEQSLGRVEAVSNAAVKNGKELVVYLSMGFGNPYGDPYDPDVCAEWTEKLHKQFGVNIVVPSDTIGSASPELISSLFNTLLQEFGAVEFGAHIHTTKETAIPKIEAIEKAGVQRIDGAIKGYGGCPMAKDDLTGNMPTELIVNTLSPAALGSKFNMDLFNAAFEKSATIFNA